LGEAQKSSQCDDPKVQAIMVASAGSGLWLREEFCGVDLGDKCLDCRLIKTAESLGKFPIAPFHKARGDWASTQAAYRRFDNDKASLEAIPEPHAAATVKRMAARGGRILLVQATIQPPQQRGHARDCGSTDPINVRVIGATASAPPAVQEAVCWVLLTSGPVADFEATGETAQRDGERRGMETWHKALRSGRRVDDCLLENGKSLLQILTGVSVIGVHLTHVAYRVRVQPDLPATRRRGWRRCTCRRRCRR
jgi:hypothetical protein